MAAAITPPAATQPDQLAGWAEPGGLVGQPHPCSAAGRSAGPVARPTPATPGPPARARLPARAEHLQAPCPGVSRRHRGPVWGGLTLAHHPVGAGGERDRGVLVVGAQRLGGQQQEPPVDLVGVGQQLGGGAVTTWAWPVASPWAGLSRPRVSRCAAAGRVGSWAGSMGMRRTSPWRYTGASWLDAGGSANRSGWARQPRPAQHHGSATASIPQREPQVRLQYQRCVPQMR